MNRALARDSGAAPATVSSELFPETSLRPQGLGKTGSRDDLQARRPAATPKNVHGRGVPAVACTRAGISRRRFCPRLLCPVELQRASRGPLMSLNLPNAEASASAPLILLRPESLAVMPSEPAMQVIRRNGTVSPFDPAKIAVAMTKAFLAVEGTHALPPRAASMRSSTAADRRVVAALTRRARRRPHLPYRGRAGSGRARADAQRASQGRARLCALPRGARPQARRRGGRKPQRRHSAPSCM